MDKDNKLEATQQINQFKMQMKQIKHIWRKGKILQQIYWPTIQDSQKYCTKYNIIYLFPKIATGEYTQKSCIKMINSKRK